MQERVCIVQTAVSDTSRCNQVAVTSDFKQRLIDTGASKNVKNLIDKAVGQWRKRLRAIMDARDITLNI